MAALALVTPCAGSAAPGIHIDGLPRASPLTGQVVAIATVPSGTTRVEFAVDGQTRWSASRPRSLRGGSRWRWNTAQDRNGPHTVRVRAVDGSGRSLTASRRVVVRNPRRVRFGIHQDLMWDGFRWRREESIAVASAVGAELSRTSFLWHVVEPQQGRRDWSRSDDVIEELEAADLTPVAVLVGSPAWANGVEDGVEGARFFVPQDPHAFRVWVARYARFAAAAARRYRGRVPYWELWNEPNEHFQWKPNPDVARYLIWYRAVAAAIRRADPGAQVAVGGLAGLSATSPGDYTGIGFLRKLCARGLRPSNVAVHPYPSDQQAPTATLRWKNNFTDIHRIRAEILRCGSQADVWVTEWGWSTERVGERTQARYIATSLGMIRLRYPYVEIATYFVDRDRASYSQGLYDEGLRPRLSAKRFGAFLRRLPPAR